LNSEPAFAPQRKSLYTGYTLDPKSPTLYYPDMSSDVDINRKIERAKHELEHMIDLNPSIMLLVDDSGTIIRANKALLQLLALDDFTNILNRKLDEVFSCEDSCFFAGLVKDRSLCKKTEATFTISGNKHLLKFTLIDSSKNAELFAMIINDVTSESEQATKREKQHKKEAVQALVGALLHNVNQPLTVIMMRAQLMYLELNKGDLQPEALAVSLRDIMRLTTDIAALLRQVETPADYVTTPYSKGVDILDIERSAGSSDFDMASIGIPQALILALDVHEPGALAHANTVSHCAFHIATKMEIEATKCETVKRCALLHDIGKLGIPVNILQKPGPLDEEEHSVIREHPEIGYKLLQNFHFLQDEAGSAYEHAEWFDGAGYPRGLAGDEISLRARIITVADAYSALTAKRSYKDAVSKENALEEIAKHSGTQFDPTIVDTLLANPPE
jgi:putative nucleotidyltransferase with HDIG domain